MSDNGRKLKLGRAEGNKYGQMDPNTKGIGSMIPRTLEVD